MRLKQPSEAAQEVFERRGDGAAALVRGAYLMRWPGRWQRSVRRRRQHPCLRGPSRWRWPPSAMSAGYRSFMSGPRTSSSSRCMKILLSRDPKNRRVEPAAGRAVGGAGWRARPFPSAQGRPLPRGPGEMTAEDVKATFAAIAREGSANSLAPEFRLIKSMEVEDPYTLTLRFEKPFVTFGNKVTQGLFASSAFIQSKKVIETMGEAAERHPVATGPWKFVEHIRATASSMRRSRTTGGPRLTSSGWCFSRCRNPPPAWPCCGRAASMSSRSAASTSRSCRKSGCGRSPCRTCLGSMSFWVDNGPRSPYDAAVPWALPDAERARKVRLALNLAVDKQAILQQVLGGWALWWVVADLPHRRHGRRKHAEAHPL